MLLVTVLDQLSPQIGRTSARVVLSQCMYCHQSVDVTQNAVNSTQSRHFSTSNNLFGKRLTEFRNKFVDRKDLNKRPSDLEIRQKDLPKNQPTLGERIERDRENLFHQHDVHHGYRAPGRHSEFHVEVLEQLKYELKTNPKELVKHSFSTVSKEISKWSVEFKSGFNFGERVRETIIRPGDTRQVWGFQTEKELDDWTLTVDSDWGEGYSTAEFHINSNGTAGMFRGNLSTRVPADGRTQYAGYANISSVAQRESFGRLKLFNYWENYTHLTMNVRGDGRKYMINLKVARDYDINWDDRYHYPLFTRGGPYWQRVKIPFSKFYLGHKGMIQDRQSPFPCELTTGIGITLKDRMTGPFQLEIKDISLINDPTGDDETFAYEMYKVPDFWAGY